MTPSLDIREHLLAGQVIPAHPLALTEERKLDERHQRALTRYYCAAGAGGIAVGVHTTQFAIREHGLYEPVLALASETADSWLADQHGLLRGTRPFVKVAGLCGRTDQALREAETALRLGYHCGLLSPGAWREESEVDCLAHCRDVARAIPLFGFYLQPAVGGRALSHWFWCRFLEIPEVVAIKVAPFNRYQTLDVVRALAESGRKDVALYTGNDDNIVGDLLACCRIITSRGEATVRFHGGLLGHWAVWTRRAVELAAEVRNATAAYPGLVTRCLPKAAPVTDMNAAIFDAANGFRGCIAGIHEVLRRQGLMAGVWCLDPNETLSPGQAEEIDRVIAAYPLLTDDDFVGAHLDEWIS